MKEIKNGEIENRVIVGRGEKIFWRINNCFMIFLAFLTIYPILYVLFASLSDPVEFAKEAGLLFKPAGFSLQAYKDLLQTSNIWLGYRNTIFYVVVGTLISLVMTALTGYALSIKGYMLKKPIMYYIIISMYFGGGSIPTFLVIQKMGMLNTIWAILIPGCLGLGNVILMKANFETIPDSLYEAAKIDGAGQLQQLLYITLPLSKAALATIGLFYAEGRWNDWYSALIYLPQRRDLYPLQLFLREILVEAETTDMEDLVGMQLAPEFFLQQEIYKYALIIISTVPILLVYPFLQKYFVKGVMVGSLKG